MTMTEDECAKAIVYMGKIWPRWKTTPELNGQWVRLLRGYERQEVFDALTAHVQQDRAVSPSMPEMRRRLAALRADADAKAPRKEPKAGRWDWFRTLCKEPGATDLACALGYWRCETHKQREAYGAPMAFAWTLCAGELESAGMSRKNAEAETVRLFGYARPTQQRTEAAHGNDAL